MPLTISTIPIITVSYNTPDLIDTLISSTRQYYDNTFYIIDGSEQSQYEKTRQICDKHENVELTHFDYNIHHGPGMAWAFNNLEIEGPALVIDSDISIINPGVFETLAEALKPDMYGVGRMVIVDENGIRTDDDRATIPYLHPSLMLCNLDVARQWPMPVLHGAPMIETMQAIHQAGLSSRLLGHLEWMVNDFANSPGKNYINHDWKGTVSRTGGYNLNATADPQIPEDADEAPDNHNKDLLAIMPPDARGILEFGCANGALANAYRTTVNSNCNYIGIDINSDQKESASRYLDHFYNIDIELAEEIFFNQFSQMINVWAFGDVLEHLKDPWKILRIARRVLPEDGCIVACIPNSQHWSFLAKVAIGDFRYEKNGLFDKTHIRFFTRATIFELFQDCGFKIEQGFPRIFGPVPEPGIRDAIKLLAESVGVNPKVVLKDAAPLQYVIKAVPN